jgi:hypothetical protein
LLPLTRIVFSLRYELNFYTHLVICDMKSLLYKVKVAKSDTQFVSSLRVDIYIYIYIL